MKLLFTLMLLLVATTPAFAGYWVAQATSPYAWGVGQSTSLSSAMRIAMHECRIRTPSTAFCSISNYYWVD